MLTPVRVQAFHSRACLKSHHSDIKGTAQKSPCVNTFLRLLQKESRLERCSGLNRRQSLGHTRAIATSHVEVPLPGVLSGSVSQILSVSRAGPSAVSAQRYHGAHPARADKTRRASGQCPERRCSALHDQQMVGSGLQEDDALRFSRISVEGNNKGYLLVTVWEPGQDTQNKDTQRTRETTEGRGDLMQVAIFFGRHQRGPAPYTKRNAMQRSKFDIGRADAGAGGMSISSCSGGTSGMLVV